MEKKISITGIKLKSNGMKGLDVVYNQQHEKDGKIWNATDTSSRKVPVGEDLEKVIKAFRYYLLDIYGYDMGSVNESECIVKSIYFDGDIEINGELKVLNGIRTVPLSAKKISDELEYDKMDELNKLIMQLKGEVEKYMDGKSVMSDSQLVMTFYKGKGKFDEVEFAGMSDEQKKLEATAILEKMGSLVIHDNEMDGSYVPDEDVEAVDVTPSIENKNVADAVIVTTGHVVESIPSPNFEAKAPELGLEEVLIIEDEDEMMFAIAPIKSVN